MNDDFILKLVERARSIKHVEIIRLGTKMPVICPQRVTQELLDRLKKFHPIFFSIHFTHPNEITPEVEEACNLLANNGFVLGSQTVLLKGINDDSKILGDLFKKLLTIRCKPYYLYSCDQVIGTKHFRTTLHKGIDIIKDLRGFISGYCLPHYVCDLPNSGGKTPLIPNYIKEVNDDHIVFNNYEGKEIIYKTK